MLKKQNLGILLLAFGVLSGVIILAVHHYNPGQNLIYAILLIFSAGCAGLGSILAFTRLLDGLAQPVVDEINADVEDDLQDLQQRRVTNAQVMVVVSAVLGAIFLVYVLKLHKFEATWGGIPVALVTLLAVGVVVFIAAQNRWFRNQRMSTPLKIYLIPAVGLALSLILGLNLAENPRALSWSPAAEVVYNETASTGMDLIGSTDPSGIFDLAVPDCDDDACVAAYLVMALIVLTFLLVALSAFVPHFWFLSGWVLIAVLGILTVHEIRLRRSLPDSPGETPVVQKGGGEP